jgi:hypothetical protein
MKKFGPQYYNVPTPKRLKFFGDALLAATGSMTVGSLVPMTAGIEDLETIKTLSWIAIISTIVGIVGKFMSKFFGDIDQEIEKTIIYEQRTEKTITRTTEPGKDSGA